MRFRGGGLIPSSNQFLIFWLALAGHNFPKFNNHTYRYANKLSKTSVSAIINPKNQKPVATGYTILEVLIFLAVSTFLMVSAIAAMSGSRRNTEFAQSLRDFESRISDVINDVPTGYYPANSTIGCQISAINGTEIVNTTAQNLGGNDDCLYVGKAIQFVPDGDDTKVLVYNIAGRRLAAGTGTPVKKISETEPVAVALPTDVSFKDSVDEISLQYGLKVTNVFDGADSTKTYGVLSVMTLFEGILPSNEVSEGQSVQIGAINGSTLNSTKDTAVSNIGALTEIAATNPGGFQTSTDGFVICLESDNGKKASLTIGAAGSGGVKLEVDNHHVDC